MVGVAGWPGGVVVAGLAGVVVRVVVGIIWLVAGLVGVIVAGVGLIGRGTGLVVVVVVVVGLHSDEFAGGG